MLGNVSTINIATTFRSHRDDGKKEKNSIDLANKKKICGRKVRYYCIWDYIMTQDECEHVDQGYRDG